MKNLHRILYYVLGLSGCGLIYYIDFSKYMFSYLAFLGFLYTIFLVISIRKVQLFNKNKQDEKSEKNSTLFITQVVFLLIAFGLQILGLTGRMEIRMMMILQVSVVLVLMNGIILNTENKLKQRHANRVDGQ